VPASLDKFWNCVLVYLLLVVQSIVLMLLTERS